MIRKTLALAAVAGIANAASAQVALTWGFTELDASYSTITNVFMLDSDGAFASSGDVTLAGVDTASFLPGSMGLGSIADFHLEMTISNITAVSADGAGQYSITDMDGDVISGNFDGAWLLTAFGMEFFNGSSADAAYTDAADGNFEGTSGSFITPDTSYQGGVSILLFQPSMFSNSFARVSSSADGQFVPTPGALILAGIGGLLAFRRNR